MKKLCAALMLTGLVGLAQAQLVVVGASGFDIAVELVVMPIRANPDASMPYTKLEIQHAGVTWDCDTNQCQLSKNATVDVLMRPESDGSRPVQWENNWPRTGLIVSATFPSQTVRDPLGADWYLVPDMADWRFGALISENTRPDDAQFMVSYGSLQLIDASKNASFTARISNQTGVVEVLPKEPSGSNMPSETQVAEFDWFFQQSPLLAAPLYALPSLDVSCMSVDCMRYERGTLMVDALRVSFALTAVVAAVPEPDTWAMMAVGLIGLGGAVMRRRRTEVLSS